MASFLGREEESKRVRARDNEMEREVGERERGRGEWVRAMWFVRSFQVAISSALNDNSVTNAVATGLLAMLLGKRNCLEISKAS